MKSTKVCLRQLQALVQQMKGDFDGGIVQYPFFNWMGKETLTALTYVLTVIQSIQTCQLERLLLFSSRRGFKSVITWSFFSKVANA